MRFKILILSLLLSFSISLHLLPTYHLQNNTSTCVSPGQFNASTGLCDCKNGSIADPTTKSCVCPKEKPVLSDGVCFACEAPNYFDESSKKCLTCPDGFKF